MLWQHYNANALHQELVGFHLARSLANDHSCPADKAYIGNILLVAYKYL
jgi:hypothetical protein